MEGNLRSGHVLRLDHVAGGQCVLRWNVECCRHGFVVVRVVRGAILLIKDEDCFRTLFNSFKCRRIMSNEV